MSGRDPDAKWRASLAVAARAIERRTGRCAPERHLAGLRDEGGGPACGDAADVLDVVIPVYDAVRSPCAARGILTRTLPRQLAAVLAHGGLRTSDGKWCR